jgi:hypothetical protein
MKTVGLIVIFCSGILALLFLLIPIGVTYKLQAYPQEKHTINGQLRVAEVAVTNDGWFSQHIALPELAACTGDQEVPLDSWLSSDSSVVRGAGQLDSVLLRSGEVGIVYYVARDATLYDKIHVYRRTKYFSCLNPGTPLDQ